MDNTSLLVALLLVSLCCLVLLVWLVWRGQSDHATRAFETIERGSQLTTVALARQLKSWQFEGDDVALVIGGPDGLDPEFKQKAQMRIRLSDMTLPHAFARVLLIEQLYRAWSINANHPYHRE